MSIVSALMLQGYPHILIIMTIIIITFNRPFTFVSCSRDTTLRVWEFDGLFSYLKMNVIWNLNFKNILESDPSVEKFYDYSMTPNSHKFFCENLAPKISGMQSILLNGSLLKHNEPLTSLIKRKQISSDPIKR